MVSPLGPMYQAGTLSGNPVAVTAGIETLKFLAENDIYLNLGEKGELLRRGLREIAAQNNLNIAITGIGSLTGLFFTDREISNYEATVYINKNVYQKFFQLFLQKGVIFPPSPFETIFLSTAHKMEDIEQTLYFAEVVFKKLSEIC